MKRSYRTVRAVAAIGAAAALLAGPTALSAAARPPPPEPHEHAGTVIEVPVEVPIDVPVDDAADETVQMALAALVGGGLMGVATAAHYRRRISEPHLQGDPLDAEIVEW